MKKNVWNVARIIKMWHRETEWTDTTGKMVTADLLDAKLSQCKVVTTTQFVKNAVSAKYNKAKCNKGRLVSKKKYIYQMYFLIESNFFHKIDHRQIGMYNCITGLLV